MVNQKIFLHGTYNKIFSSKTQQNICWTYMLLVYLSSMYLFQPSQKTNTKVDATKNQHLLNIASLHQLRDNFYQHKGSDMLFSVITDGKYLWKQS